jgi:hypothetical protein
MSVHKGLKAFKVRKVKSDLSVPWGRRGLKDRQVSPARSV